MWGAGVLLLRVGVADTKKPGKVAQDTTSPAFTVAVNRLFAFRRFRFRRFARFRLAGLLFRVFFHLRFVAAYGLGHGSHSPEKIKLPEKAFLNFLMESPIWVARILVLPFSVPILSRSSKEKEHQKTIGVEAYVLLDNFPKTGRLYKKYRAVSERNQNNFSFIFKSLPPGAGREEKRMGRPGPA